MALISSCPRCEKQVSVPSAHPASKVRCPLCQEAFPLQAALDLAPPMLEVVESPAGATIDLADVAGNGSHITAPAAMAALGKGFADEAPSFTEALSFDAPPIEDSEELDTELEGKAPSFDDLLSAPGDDEEALDLHEMPADESPFSLGGPNMASAAAGAELPAVEFGEGSALGVSAAASAVKRRKREPSFIGNLIGVVGGGVVGCGLAYFIVLWIGGPEKDFLELGPKLPKWMLPAAFNQPKPLAATPMASNPTPADLDEVKQAGGGEDLNVNVPALPDAPADAANTESKLPFAPEEAATTDAPESPEDVAADLTNDPTTIDPEPAASKETEPIADPEPTEESASFDEPVTTDPIPEVAAPSGEIGPKEPASYEAEELDQVVDAINKLRAEVAKAGDKAPGTLKTQYYKKLYRLGEVVTFAQGADSGREAAAALLTELASEPSKFNEIGMAGIKWLTRDPAKRGEDKGVLLAGTVEEVAQAADMHRMLILTAGDKSPVSVYTPTKPDLAPGDTVLVLGSIVANPKDSLHNFTDDEMTVVWHGLSVKVDR